MNVDKHGGESGGSPRLHRISEHLYVFDDICQVYILIEGERALLVDCGSGEVADVLQDLGIRHVDWVVHTHHHRDGCWGDARLVAMGARLAVPEREAHLFEEVEDFWNRRSVFDNYDLTSDPFSLPRDVPVSARLADYATFDWACYRLRVVPTPGHTQGAVSLLVEVDGSTVAMTGDVITAPGRLWEIHPLQWQYGGGWGDAGGIQSTALSLVEVLDLRPDLLLPSHGPLISEPALAIRDLLGRLREVQRYLDGSAFLPQPTWLASDRQLGHVSRHLWMNRAALANSYTIIGDDGRGLFLDYGYPSLSHFSGKFRFARHSLRELAERGGMTKPDVFIPSHYHDDHIAGAPLLQQEFGVEMWAHEVFADILRHPGDHALPCLLPDPLEVSRDLRDGERFAWNGFPMEIRHTPGHTYYASSLLVELDGLRVVLTGDNLHLGRFGPLLGGPIYRNRFRPEDFVTSLQVLCDWSPDLLLTGHSGAIQVEPAWLDSALRRARDLAGLLPSLVPNPSEIGFALDPQWVSITPYQSTVRRGDEVTVTVTVRNHFPERAHGSISLDVPDGWRAEPAVAEFSCEPYGEAQASFAVEVQRFPTPTGKAVFCAVVDLAGASGQARRGPVAEGIVTVLVDDHAREHAGGDTWRSMSGQASRESGAIQAGMPPTPQTPAPH